ncbi:TIGR02646 family protein [Nostoc spongiaeforme FACHB-130]|uniref:TIGR02646 family protein n=1 Tax=Nostoc spongiaeforme FACHB-130 TaxID=1357510 RepID=A0ABR8FR58_9NOSO|nr:retron system putative HNH endonuclease [Nostoc spongiaeforme]MBD2593435.1 TIGR02646 family protein [Nostoc spongiaeforme FACHB-130]
MKYIKKGEEPEKFVVWKALANDDWEPNWNNLQSPEKPILHDALLKEQGYICCYCGMQITKATSHIEHLKPRKYYPHLALEYTNLIASCQGESEEPPPVPVHCGHQKKYWYDEKLMISSLEANCGDFFKYLASGEILPTDELDKKDAAQTTIEKLALNISKLQNMRRMAIEAVLLDIDELSELEIQQLVQGYAQADANGQYTPFCAAIAYLLQNYFCHS